MRSEPLMDRVWEAYWQPEPHGTKAALERVVATILEDAAHIADKHVEAMRSRLQQRSQLSEIDEAMFESAQWEAFSIAGEIRAALKMEGNSDG